MAVTMDRYEVLLERIESTPLENIKDNLRAGNYVAWKVERQGCVDTPAKFGKGFASRFRFQKGALIAFYLKEWKWIVSVDL